MTQAFRAQILSRNYREHTCRVRPRYEDSYSSPFKHNKYMLHPNLVIIRLPGGGGGEGGNKTIKAQN